MNEDEQGGLAADGYEATETDGGFSFGLDGTDLDDPTEAETDQPQPGAGGDGEPKLPELPAGFRAVKDDEYSELETLRSEVERYRPYSFLVETAQQFGDADTFKNKLEEQRILTEQNQQKEVAAGYTQQAVDYARQQLAQIAQQGGMDEEVVDAVADLMGQIYGPIANRLAQIEPLIGRIEQQDKVTLAGRTVSDLMKPTSEGGKGFEFMDEEAVKEAIVEGRDYLGVARRTHERGLQIAKATENRLKSTRQEEAIKRGSPPSPPVEGVRRQSASTTASLPDPIRDRENYLKARAEQKRRMDRGEPAY